MNGLCHDKVGAMLLRALVHFGNAPLAFSSAIFDCALGRREWLGPHGSPHVGDEEIPDPWQGFASFHQTTFQVRHVSKETFELGADIIYHQNMTKFNEVEMTMMTIWQALTARCWDPKSSEFGYVCWPSTSWSLSDRVLQFSFALSKICRQVCFSCGKRRVMQHSQTALQPLVVCSYLFGWYGGSMASVSPQKKSKMFLFTCKDVTYLLSSCFAWFEYE